MMNPLNILLAEADASDTTSIRWALDKLQVYYQLTHVKNGAELIHHLEIDETTGKLPYIILLDLDLPDKNGISVLSEIQNRPSWKKIKCFILSKSGKRPDSKDTRHLSIAGYISKPFQLSNSLSMDSLNFVMDLVNYKSPD